MGLQHLGGSPPPSFQGPLCFAFGCASQHRSPDRPLFFWADSSNGTKNYAKLEKSINSTNFRVTACIRDSNRSHQFTYGASASRLPSRHGGRDAVSTPRRRRSGVRTLTKRGPAAFPAPFSQIPLASTCLAPASSFCGRSFQTRKTSIRSSSRAAEPPFGVLFFSLKEIGRSGFFSQVRVDPTVVSPAAISITAAPAERSCQGRTAHTGLHKASCDKT